MQVSERSRAVAAAVSVSAELGLAVGDPVVLHDSNALTLRLPPADVLARVAPAERQSARFEVDIARRLAAAGCPVGAPDPRGGGRVHERDGFVVTLWTYHEPVAPEVPPADYADALRRMHAGMRGLDVPAPHFTDRVGQALRLVEDRDLTPGLADADRALLGGTLRNLGRMVGGSGAEQLLHGEPHPGNVLAAVGGPLFIDFETCCRGPVEFDLAHAPEEAGAYYPGVDRDLLRACRILVSAMVAAWRWDRDDGFPDGRRMGEEWLARVRAALDEAPDPRV